MPAFAISANARSVKVSASGVPATLVAFESNFPTTSRRFSRSRCVTFASPKFRGCLDRMVRAGLANHTANGVLAETAHLTGDLGVCPMVDVVKPKDRLHPVAVPTPRRVIGTDLLGHITPNIVPVA